MRPLRIVLTADNHLGRHYDRLAPARLERRRAWLRDGFRAAVDRALAWRADLFVQAGDLFDSTSPPNAERAFVAAELARLRAAGVRVLAVGGNHDTPRGRLDAVALPQEVYARLDGLRLLGDGAPFEVALVEAEGYRVAVGGLAWDPALGAGQDPLAGFAWDGPRADLNLLVLHRSIEGHIHPAAEEPIVRLATLAELDGVDAVLAGHVHRHAVRLVGGRLVVIPGASERMTFGELDLAPGFVELALRPGGVERVEHVPVPCQPRVELAVAVEELPAEDPTGALIARLEERRDPDALARLKLVGRVGRERLHQLGLRQLLDYGAAAFFAFDLDTDELEIGDAPARGPAERGARLSLAEELTALAAERCAAPGADRELIAAARDRALSALEAARSRL